MSKSQDFLPKDPDSFKAEGGTIEGLFDMDKDYCDEEVVYLEDYDKLKKAYRELYTKYNELHCKPRQVDPQDRIRVVCSYCGGTHVKADAYAIHNEEKQIWELSDVYDKGSYCDDCDGDCSYDYEPLTDEQPAVLFEVEFDSHPSKYVLAHSRWDVENAFTETPTSIRTMPSDADRTELSIDLTK